MSLEMVHKVIVPQKKNYVPQFLNSSKLIVIIVLVFVISPVWNSALERRSEFIK
jgi:hypothetical protein